MFKINARYFKKPMVSLLVFLFILSPLTSVFAENAVILVDQNLDITAVEVSVSTVNEKNDVIAIDDSVINEEIKESVVELTMEADDSAQSEFLTSESPVDTNVVINPSTAKQLLPSSDQLSGALIYEYLVSVPPGRNGLQPDIKLTYNNQTSEEGTEFGFGWDINIPYIQRVNKNGVEKLYTQNYFNSSLDGELVSADTNTWMAKTENGDFRTYIFSNNQWIMKDKNGTQYKFGYTAIARQDDSSDTSKVYKWLLEEVRDTNDNYIKYEYYKNAGQIYPYRITYTGNGTTDGIFQIEFLKESRDDAITNNRPGFSVTTFYRIYEIDIKVNGSLTHRYGLDYSDNNGSRSLLFSITETGIDDLGNSVILPDTTFEYQEETPGWTFAWTTPVYPVSPFVIDYANDRIVDVNGDGFLDMLSTRDDTTRTYINNGDSWVFNNDWEVPNFRPDQGRIKLSSGNSFVVDINGDALADIIYGGESIYINQGLGWVYDDSWEIPALMNVMDYNLDKLADVNGDGLIDIVSTRHGYTNDYTTFYINNGSGWDYDQQLETPFVEGVGHFSVGGVNAQLVDINGDSLVDIVYNSDIFINQGHSWIYDDSWEIPALMNGVYYNLDRFIDVNGDGLIDIVSTRHGYTNDYTSFYINNGSGWDYDDSWQTPSQIALSNSYFNGLVDVNGDGITDLIYSSSVYVNNGDKVDLLTTINNNKGGFTDIIYKTTPQYRSGSTQLNPKLPFVLDTVYQLVTNDGANNIVTKTYSYEGGQYYFNTYIDRKFAGFNKVITTDAVGNTTKLFFHQGDASDSSQGEYNDDAFKIGKIYRTEVADSTGNIYSKSINKWDDYDLGNGNKFVKLAQTLEMTYDGNSTHKDKAETYSYDNANGNLTQKIELGEVIGNNDGVYTDIGTDDFMTTISYVSNTGANILGLPSQQTVVDHNFNKVKETKYYYDAQALGGVIKGNLTKQEDWKSGTAYVNARKTYDGVYGLVTMATDPRGKTTRYIYDSYHLYPATITNALNQSTQYTYDYSSGKVKRITDPNSRIFENVYDGLDRLIIEKQPDITDPATLVAKTEYIYTDTPNAVNIHRTDNLDSLISRETYQYFDGLSRLIQERREAEGSNYQIKDIIYNNRDLVSKESLDYFSVGSGKTTPTTATALYNNYTYDPLSRIVSTANAVGTTINVYDDWKLSITDVNGKIKDLYRDAYNNLVRVGEHHSASIYTTIYQYNYLGNLVKITDASNNIRNFTYDGLGRRLTAQDLHSVPDVTFGTWGYSYDDAGNLISSTNPNGQTVAYTYDNLNRRFMEDYITQVGTEIYYIYDSGVDGIGQLTGVITGGLTQTNIYNPLGLLKHEIKTINSTSYQTDYEYDRQGNQTIITDPSGFKVKYNYNSAGLLNSIQKKEVNDSIYLNVIHNFNYSPLEQPTTIYYANGAVTANTYDATKLYRMSNKVTTVGGGSYAQRLAYTFDNIGNITRIVDSSASSTAKTANYVYDDLHRLTQAAITNVAVGQAPYTENYSYNPIGNIIFKTGQNLYVYAGNQGTSYANPHAVTNIDNINYTYDRNGNLIFDSFWAYSWDYRNRLIQATKGTTTIRYGYDQNDNRIWVNNGLTITTYPTKYYNITSTGTTTKHIFAGSELMATIEGTGATATKHYIHSDHLGGSGVVTNSANAVEELIDYYPFGDIRFDRKIGSFNEQRKFTGHEYDVETGLNYMMARYQNGTIGRFLSQDPGTRDNPTSFLKDPQQLNYYSYARNNPLIAKDPNGKWIQYVVGQNNAVSLGNWANNQYQNSSAARFTMDHPYVPAIAGAAPLAIYGVGSLSAEALTPLVGSTLASKASLGGTAGAAGGIISQFFNDISKQQVSSPNEYAASAAKGAIIGAGSEFGPFAAGAAGTLSYIAETVAKGESLNAGEAIYEGGLSALATTAVKNGAKVMGINSVPGRYPQPFSTSFITGSHAIQNYGKEAASSVFQGAINAVKNMVTK